MPIEFKKKVVVLDDVCEVEDAEPLLSWLLENPRGKLNLKGLVHPHAAVLQVLMAMNPEVSTRPKDPAVAEWIMPLLEG